MIGTKVLEERKSKYNGAVRVLKTWGMGTYIQADGITQSGGIVESIWSKTIKKVSKVSQVPKVPKVLILGLGGGTVAKVIRKCWPEAKITGIEIDPVMVELAKKYLGLRETGVDIKIADAKDYKLSAKSFDLVIVDTYLGDRFIDIPIKSSGLVIFNRLFYKGKKAAALKFGKKLERIYSRVEHFYPPTNLMFICYK